MITVHSANISARRRRLGCFHAKMSIVTNNNVYLFFVMMCIGARTDSPSLVMVALKRVFSRRNVLKNRSDVIVDVHKILTNDFGRSWISFFVLRSCHVDQFALVTFNVCTIGNSSLSHSSKA